MNVIVLTSFFILVITESVVFLGDFSSDVVFWRWFHAKHSGILNYFFEKTYGSILFIETNSPLIALKEAVRMIA